MNEIFRKISRVSAEAMGASWSFILAIVLILVWAVTGPAAHYSDTWQLVINTGTTVLTFLMVFLIQNTQNRDSKAIHLKLDELIRSGKTARNTLLDLEDMSDEELDVLEKEFKALREKLNTKRQV